MRSTLFIILGLLFSIQANAQGVIRADVLGLPPWGYRAEEGHFQGVMYDITRKILEESNLEHELKVLPVKRMLQRLNAGQADLTVILRSKWSEENLLPLAPIFTNINSIVLAQKGIQINSYQDAINLKLGMVRGTKIGHKIETEQDLDRINTNNYLQSAHLLKANRVEAIVGVEPSLYWVTRKVGLSKNELAPPLILKTSSIWLHVRPNWLSDETQQRLITTVDRLKGQGYFQSVLDDYLNNR